MTALQERNEFPFIFHLRRVWNDKKNEQFSDEKNVFVILFGFGLENFWRISTPQMVRTRCLTAYQRVWKLVSADAQILWLFIIIAFDGLIKMLQIGSCRYQNNKRIFY